MKNSKGFTLIEVLIALAIISIALTAIIKATSQNIKNNIYLQEKTIANWVGTEIMNEATIGLLQLPPAPDKRDGDLTMLGKTWHWQAHLVATPNPHIQKITVSVFGTHENVLMNLESFIYVAQK